MFDCFSERFLGILKNWKFILFFWIFPSFDPTGCTGHVFPRNYIQTSSTLAWTLSGMFLDAFEISFFFHFFFRFFPSFDPPGCSGQEKFEKLPKASLDAFGKVFRVFENLNSFRFLWNFFESPGCTGQSFFRRKNQSKHSQTMFFGNVFGEFWKFRTFVFFKFFPSLDPPGCTGDFFLKEIPQNRFRTCLDNIRDSFGHLRNIEIFHFFQSFPYSTLQVALGKNFAKNITSKHVQNMFHCFWERFLGI